MRSGIACMCHEDFVDVNLIMNVLVPLFVRCRKGRIRKGVSDTGI
jgi:hypothetical protein